MDKEKTTSSGTSSQCICKDAVQANFESKHHLSEMWLFHPHKLFPSVCVCISVCSFDPRAFRWAQTMRLAVEEINQNADLLPNYTLGYTIFDSCAYPLTGQRAALAVLLGLSEEDSPMCNSTSPLLAVIGESGSALSIVVSRILLPFRIPMVMMTLFFISQKTSLAPYNHLNILYWLFSLLKISYFSSCACLSDRRKYPNFFRVLPNDDYQVRVLH